MGLKLTYIGLNLIYMGLKMIYMGLKLGSLQNKICSSSFWASFFAQLLNFIVTKTEKMLKKRAQKPKIMLKYKLSKWSEPSCKLTYIGLKLSCMGLNLTFIGLKLSYMGLRVPYMGLKLSYMGLKSDLYWTESNISGAKTYRSGSWINVSNFVFKLWSK